MSEVDEGGKMRMALNKARRLMAEDGQDVTFIDEALGDKRPIKHPCTIAAIGGAAEGPLFDAWQELHADVWGADNITCRMCGGNVMFDTEEHEETCSYHLAFVAIEKFVEDVEDEACKIYYAKERSEEPAENAEED